ncbi:hypothetical protein HZI73_07365 [Vallitalea pronyensis]|uniref:CN hydrolase domain-containing protein n=1 Tax=Vallitalea pronyensis TaxID=1348613 RepID=A0A8J8MIC0_9FIRM|nr:nitrilase-related carbon-nitrogen hydrolase [Vallitalea pronyensis]QUI22129.1 hypothetical protein HZI73_07365 [Vallitalea pronyensis]
MINNIKTILLLLLSSLLLILSNGHYIQAYAAWLFPLGFLMATHPIGLKKSVLVLCIICGVAFQISFLYFSSRSPGNFMFYIPFFMGLVMVIPFWAQKLAFHKSKHFIATLIFPASLALYEFAISYLSPNGTFGILGYSQHDFLPMIQWVSVIGVVGITFVVTWTSTVVYWVIFINHEKKGRRYAAILGVCLLGMLMLGTYRLEMEQDAATVQVSGIHVYDLRQDETGDMLALMDTDEERFREETTKLANLLVAQTIEEAKMGSKIIVHAEVSPYIHYQDIAAYIDALKKAAKDYGVYIVSCPYVDYPEGKRDENFLHVINPDGELVITHYKYGGNIFEGTVKGDEVIQYVDTPYGRLSGIICWDKDFPHTIRQVGEKNIDILFIPSADWKQITPYHSIVGKIRGIENGVNTVTQTINGTSMIADTHGQVLQQMNHFTSDNWVMRGQVPMKGKKTIYHVVGKYLLLCDIIILMFVVLSILFRNKKNSSQT